jgi:hypothetical protein
MKVQVCKKRYSNTVDGTTSWNVTVLVLMNVHANFDPLSHMTRVTGWQPKPEPYILLNPDNFLRS